MAPKRFFGRTVLARIAQVAYKVPLAEAWGASNAREGGHAL